MADKLRFGTSSGTGYTRAKFPTHLGVAKGPLNKMSDFDSTFARERDKQGPGGEFTYKGKRYTTDRADDKKTAISSAKTKDKDQIQQDQVDLTNSFSTSGPIDTSKAQKNTTLVKPKKIDIVTTNPKTGKREKIGETNTSSRPGGSEPVVQTPEEKRGITKNEIKQTSGGGKGSSKKEGPSFLNKLGAGLEEAGAMIALGPGQGKTMTEGGMAYKKMKEDLKTKRLLNERRAYINTDAGNMELKGEDPVEKQDDKMKKDVYSGDNIKNQEQESDAANQAIVSENASIENRRDNNAGATDCPSGTCPAYE